MTTKADVLKLIIGQRERRNAGHILDYAEGLTASLELDDLSSGKYATGLLRVAAAVQDAETVTIGADVYEVDTRDAAHITSGRIRLDLHAGSTVKSQGTLTIAEPVTSGDTMTIGDVVYTFVPKNTAGDAGEIDLGDSEADTKLNIVAAIKGGTASPTWQDGGANANVANPWVTCPAAFTGDTLVLTAIVGGTKGNLVPTTETLTHISNIFDAATLGTTRAGVDATAAEFTTALLAAINASAVEAVHALRLSANAILVYADSIGAVALGTTETLGGANNVWGAATLTRGAAVPAAVKKSTSGAIVPDAAEVGAGLIAIPVAFDPTAVQVQVYVTSGGAVKAWGGTVAITPASAPAPAYVLLSNNGTNNYATTDTIYYMFSE